MYKLIDNGVKRLSDGACIPNDPNNKDWNVFQEWLLRDGVPQPQYDLEELRAKRILELSEEKDKRIDSLIGTTSARDKDRMLSRSIKLLRKELKGNAKAEEVAELDALEALDDAIDALEAHYKLLKSYLESEERTEDDFKNYNAKDDALWIIN